jgi:hypothetical protein
LRIGHLDQCATVNGLLDVIFVIGQDHGGEPPELRQFIVPDVVALVLGEAVNEAGALPAAEQNNRAEAT